ncbi:unnamed protein product [Effrenium voratum]|uniref:SET domain-containing protein n=1 Tax=Effrenium voratum TaxID=2562239 RepID=A0AA36IBT1_9DINO|nr:unnamed protein product [Effrenium voratum]
MECQELLSWGLENGAFVHEGIDLFAQSPRGRGIVATADLKSGEVLLRIPGGLSIQSSPEQMPDSAVADFFRRSDAMSNALRLSLTLLHELHVQGTASRWWPYLSFLSTVEVDLPMTWPQSEWEGLRGTSLLLAGDFEPPAQVFREVAEPLMAQREDLWPEEVRKPELFLRALSLVMSRGLCGALSFALQGALAPELRNPGKAAGPFLLPLFDLVNHSSCSEELSVQLDMEEGSFVARCSKDVAAGQELLKSYGPHSAAELLRTYGFVERGSNAHNSLLVTHEELLDTCKEFVAPHLERLQDMAAVRPMYSIPSSGTLPAELLTVVQVLHMSSADFSEFQTSQTLSFPRGTTQGRKAVVCVGPKKFADSERPQAPAARAACAALRAAELQVLQEARRRDVDLKKCPV